MIVGKDDARAAVCCRVRDDFAQGEGGRALAAVVAGKVDAACLVVDMRHPDMLAPLITLRQAAREEPPGRVQPVQSERRFGTLMEHAGLNMREGGQEPREPNPERSEIAPNPINRAWSAARWPLVSAPCGNIST